MEEMTCPHIERPTPLTLRALTIKLVLMLQRYNVFYCFNTRKHKFFDVDSLKCLPRTLFEELTSFSKFSGSFAAVDGMQTFWRIDKDKDGSRSTSHLETYAFDWGGSYSIPLDFEDYPYSPYFQPKRTRFFMDICRKFYSNVYYFAEVITFSQDPTSFYTKKDLTFADSHCPSRPTQNFFENGKWTSLYWTLPTFPWSTSDVNEMIVNCLTLKLDYSENFYFEDGFLIFEEQKFLESSESVEYCCITKYRLKKIPYTALWPLDHNFIQLLISSE